MSSEWAAFHQSRLNVLTNVLTRCNDSHMNTNTAIRNADTADMLAAGMSFPVRNALVPMNHVAAVALFQARREFWLAAAGSYAAQVAAGCTDAAHDVADALAQAERYAA